MTCLFRIKSSPTGSYLKTSSFLVQYVSFRTPTGATTRLKQSVSRIRLLTCKKKKVSSSYVLPKYVMKLLNWLVSASQMDKLYMWGELFGSATKTETMRNTFEPGVATLTPQVLHARACKMVNPRKEGKHLMIKIWKKWCFDLTQLRSKYDPGQYSH